MAAIAYPEFQPSRIPRRPQLRILPPVEEPVEEVVRRSERTSMAAVYRRRRVAAAVIGVVMLAGAVTASSAIVGRLGASAAATVPAPPPVTRLVQPGDTFWLIAVAEGADGDVMERVDALIAANGGSAELNIGDRIVVSP